MLLIVEKLFFYSCCCYITFYCSYTYYSYNAIVLFPRANRLMQLFAYSNVLAFFGGILMCAYLVRETLENGMLSKKIKGENQTLSDENKILSDKNKVLSDDNKMLSNKNETSSDKNKTLSDKNYRLSDENEMLSDKNEMLSDKNKSLSDKNKSLSDENKSLSDENKSLSDENKTILAENKKLLNKNNDLLKKDEAVKNREIQLNQEVANRVEEELAKLSEDISTKKKTIEELNEEISIRKATTKELNQEISLLLPIRSQINNDRMSLVSKEKNLEIHVLRMESQMATLQYQLGHQSQDNQNTHALEVLQKMNEQVRIISQTFQASHDKDMEIVQSAIEGQNKCIEAMEDLTIKVAEREPEICIIDNKKINVINNQNRLMHLTSSKQYSSSKSLTCQKNKMKAITN